MKYNDITEYQKIPPLPEQPIPTISGMTKLANQIIQSKIGPVQLYASQELNTFTIAAAKDSTVIGFIHVQKGKPYNNLLRSYVQQDYRRLGVVSNILAWCRENSIPLISDTQITDVSIALWKNLEKFNLAKVINVETGETFFPQDAPVHPENDSFYPDRWSSNNPNGQKYFYIIEGSPSNRLNEHIVGSTYFNITPKTWFTEGF